MRTMPSTLRSSISSRACGIEVISWALKYGDSWKPAARSVAVGRRVFQHDGDRHVLHVERQAVAEQQDQNHRQHDADGDAAGIADHLTPFFANERRDAPQTGREADRDLLARTESCGASCRRRPARLLAARVFDDRDERVFHRRLRRRIPDARGGESRPACPGPARGRRP